ncbi:CLUMA_CG021362, isoform A [Clunio marinus]|uniref:protein-tyrosine-phosphatase n=1 Tax=Clunio marinus TaxID=568069 RepID=A0A1J1J8F0_9DIPT|nr:CLUMA_CG021362, isoform A [Clunio marinus]
MFERFKFGSYRIEDTELATHNRKSKSSPNLVLVKFLDNTNVKFNLDKKAKGSDLLATVFDHLELTERDYFGLKFCQSENAERWLDSNKNVRKQWQKEQKNCSPSMPILEFRVKFYVSDPSRLLEEYTRYQFYLQIKRDIWSGRLPVSLHTACLLASFQVQSELGDFNAVEHTEGYLNDLQLLVDQNEETERQIAELHKLHRGQLPADAECNFLEHAKRLDQYGIDFHKATDSSGTEIQLGVSAIGLLVYQNSLRINTFSWSKMTKVSFKRKEFFIQLRREPSESYDTLLGFNMASHKRAKILWQSCVEHHSFFRLQKPHRSSRFALSLGSRFRYSGRTELQAVQDSKVRVKMSKSFIRSPSRRALASSPINGMSADSNGTSNGKLSFRPHDKITVTESKSPRKAWEKQESGSSENEFIDRSARFDSSAPPLFDSPPAYDSNENTNKLSEEGLVSLRLKSDEHGRFGFNVKGGIDLKMPIFVSRVAPHTPAYNSKICENDQVVMINGRDVSTMTHEQVVSLIRNSRDNNGGQLNLIIKPNALEDGSLVEEPLYQYVPEDQSQFRNSQHSFMTGSSEANVFQQSLLLLSDGIASGTLLSQYEQMYRKNCDLSITEARKPENASKNRYRDISPYDCTRVVLMNQPDGDYINANYVNMEIPNGTINRYIATQGPLGNTVKDFWRMVQQESSHLIVMLTTVMERGRVKCHQYWPANDEILDMGQNFTIKCFNEHADETGSFVFRDMLMSDGNTGEKRTIQHMQYLAWPDHGVPSDPKLFLSFTEKVRLARNTTLLQEIEATLKQVKLKDADENGGLDGERKNYENGESPCDLPPSTSVHQCISAANPPIIIHCSAGIGRTGVLILMDTALALMEAKEPVYPLDIVQTMRDQRASMVQNVSQYKFVCECIIAAYNKMLEEDETKTSPRATSAAGSE